MFLQIVCVPLANSIYCGSELGCTDAKMEATDIVQCSGRKACQRSNISSNVVTAFGQNSAQYSIISAPIIQAFGSYALKKAVIDSENNMSLQIYMYGYYSGTGASIICRDGSHCTVYCKHNGCKKLKY